MTVTQLEVNEQRCSIITAALVKLQLLHVSGDVKSGCTQHPDAC